MAQIILASQSPRRKQLLEAAEIQFEIQIANVDEDDLPDIDQHSVPEYLAQMKAAVIAEKNPGAIIIAADTIVLLDGEILGKPKDEIHANQILVKLSGRTHEVITGVCLQQQDKRICFSVTTQVCFRKLTTQQIGHYVKHYKPFDKAGAYAIQEWIGMVGIEKITGDYYNVMGLPVGEVVKRLELF